jgi:hypothetical protein
MPVSDSVTPPDALVVTSIAAPNAVLRALAEGSIRHNVHFYNIGDSKTPAGFALDGCDYYPLERQRASGLAYPEEHRVFIGDPQRRASAD